MLAPTGAVKERRTGNARPYEREIGEVEEERDDAHIVPYRLAEGEWNR